MAGYLILTVGVSGAIFGAGAIMGAVTGQQGLGVPGYTGPQHAITLIYDNALAETHIVFDGRLLDKRIEGRAHLLTKSENGAVGFAATSNEYGQNESFYCIKGGSVTHILSDARAIWVSNNESFPFNGEIVFLLSEGTLYRVGLPDGKRNAIIDHIGDLNINTRLSADGKGLLYSYKSDKTAEDFYQGYQMYYYRDGENIKIGNDLSPISVSNNGEFYFYDYEQKAFYYMSGPVSERKFVFDDSLVRLVARNEDQGQMLFYNMDEQQAFFVENAKKTMITGGLPESLIPIKPQSDMYFTGNTNTWYMDQIDPRRVKKANDLKQTLYFSNRDIWYLKKDLSAFKIASEIVDFRLSNDSLTFFYVNEEGLYRIRPGRSLTSEKIVSDVYNFEISADGNTVYYVDRDRRLFYIKGSGDPVKITDHAGEITISQNDTLFFKERSDSATNPPGLYSCTNEKDIKFIASDVYKLYINPNSDHNIFTVSTIGHEVDVYVENSKGVFERILKDVSTNF